MTAAPKAKDEQPAAPPRITSEKADLMCDPAFWLDFAPGFHIGGKPGKDRVKLAAKAKDACRDKLIREGYVHMPAAGLGAPFAAMNDLFDKMVENGFPPVFSFVYDEFWNLKIQLADLLGHFMDGADYAMLPDFWAWRVASGQSGWAPHRDKPANSLFPDRKPKSLTVWLPLNEAHPLNGCMYVLPADRDIYYGVDNAQGFGGKLPDIRALPAQAGDVLAWTQHVFHWGSHAADSHPYPPRMSVAFEYQRLDVPSFNRPLLEPAGMPDFESRLALIAKQVMQYRHMYAFTLDLVEAATKFSKKYSLPADISKIPA